MNKRIYIALLIVASLPNLVTAKGTAQLLRGGYGFLFPDANSFANPGQMALTNGSGLEAYYTRNNQSQLQALTPSFVWGNGKFGLGAFATRTGTKLTGSDAIFSDQMGAAIGLSLVKEKLTFGVEAHRSISRGQTNDGIVNASLNLNGPKRMGFTMGVGGGTTINNAVRNVRTARASIGWGFNQYSNIEGQYALDDLDDTSNRNTISGYVNVGGPKVYFGSGYSYAKLTTSSQVMGRLGFVFGAIDLSAHAEHVLTTGANPSWGGTLRATF